MRPLPCLLQLSLTADREHAALDAPPTPDVDLPDDNPFGDGSGHAAVDAIGLRSSWTGSITTACTS